MSGFHPKAWSILAARYGRAPVLSVSEHGQRRMRQRKISQEAIREALLHPLRILPARRDGDARAKVVGENQVVVFINLLGIVTVYPTDLSSDS